MANLSNGVNIYMIINKLFYVNGISRVRAYSRDVLRRGATRCVIVASACVNL